MKKKLAGRIVQFRIFLLILMLGFAVFCVTTIGRTRINYDLTKYLSKDTMTQKALVVMEEEFGSSEQLRMMFIDQDEASMEAILEKLEQKEEIFLVSYDASEDRTGSDGKTYQLVTLTLNECDAAALVTELRSMFPEADEYYVGGSAASQLDIQKYVGKEIPMVMMIAVAVVLGVLILTSHAWLEPVIILIVLAVSILINMGTNFIFKDVSFITFAVCSILQLALSIDYAIMLLHTYNDCRDQGMEAAGAMKDALSQCFMRIASSAMTTVAGLLSLLFMSFTIGFDIGLVLSKGIIISMLGVFLLMPAVTLMLEKPLLLTRHKPIRLGGEHLAAFILRIKKPLVAILVLAVLCGLWLNSRVTYIFTDSGSAEIGETAVINEICGSTIPLVLLVPGGDDDSDYDLQRDLVQKLEAIRMEDGSPAVKAVSAMVTTGEAALQYYTAQDVSEMTGMDTLAVKLFFALQGLEEPVRADRLLKAAESIAGSNETVKDLREQLAMAEKVFHGSRYDRMILEIGFQTFDPDFNSYMEAILSAAEEVYGKDYYVTGMPMSCYDIGNAFHGDLLKVNLITLFAILLIVVISFKALKLPLLLVFVIEGAIWITMGISYVIGEPVFFISYLICLSIQMGATIDYGILLSDQYRTIRREGIPVRDALQRALKKALPTIMTSGIILVTAGYIVGKMCSIYYIYSIGFLVSRGAFVSAVLVLTLLPGCLALFDRQK